MDSNELNERLDILIRLQAHNAVSHYETQKEKILFLDRLGMRPTMISSILGTSANTVNVALSVERKKKSRSNNER